MSPLIELIALSPNALHALAAGDLVEANENTPLTLSPYFVDPEFQSTWIRRSKQIGCSQIARGQRDRCLRNRDPRHNELMSWRTSASSVP